MTSPVDTSVKYFTSLMSGAPALSGTAGAMIALLDACLKDGFDQKALTSLTVAGGVATAAYTGAHSAAIDSVVLIAGVTGGPAGWAGLNGEQKITGKGAASVTFATNLPDGAYTGAATMKMAPLGFAKPFAGPNLAGYQSADPASTKMLLRIDDTAATVCRVIGYEQMSDINTGVGPFPTNLQLAGGGYWGKSVAANATAIQWVLFGDSRGFYLHVCPNSGGTATSIQGHTKMFGDARVLKPGGDAYACFLGYSVNNNPAIQIDGQPEFGNSQQHAAPRGILGIGGAALHACYPYIGAQTSLSGADAFFGPLPNANDGRVRFSPRYFAISTGNPPRAELPGLYSVPHNNAFDAFKFNDRIPGSDQYAGRSFFVINSANASMQQSASTGNCGMTVVDVTGPWVR